MREAGAPLRGSHWRVLVSARDDRTVPRRGAAHWSEDRARCRGRQHSVGFGYPACHRATGTARREGPHKSRRSTRTTPARSVAVRVGRSHRWSGFESPGSTTRRSARIRTCSLRRRRARSKARPLRAGTEPRFDRDFGKLGMPFFMAPINARNVRRSLALSGRLPCSYEEGISVAALLKTGWLWLSRGFGYFVGAPIPLSPKPGQGPPEWLRRAGKFRVVLKARSATGRARDDGRSARTRRSRLPR